MQADATKEQPRRRLADKLFLGPEFLTWLYFTLLDAGLELPAADLGIQSPDPDGVVAFAIGKRASLAVIDAGGARVALSGPGLDDNGELLQAVRRGALLSVLSLEVSILSRVYALTLRADGAIVGLKLPDLFTEPEEPEAEAIEPARKKRKPKLPLEDVLALRAQCTAEIETVVDGLFTRFLRARLDGAWHRVDVAGIRKRVTAGLQARLPAEAVS